MTAPLRNPRHERFCRAIVFEGMHPQEAYVIAGYEPNRANHNKLLNRPDVKARIERLTQDRVNADRAAKTPIKDILVELKQHGIERLADLFETSPSQSLAVRDLHFIRPEIGLALISALRDGMGVSQDS